MQEIQNVIEKHPNLTAHGFGVGPAVHPEEFKLCVTWLSERDLRIRRRTINYKLSSYTWKHIVERSVKEYISNGAFICAALHLGFKMKKIDPISPNVCFNMKKTEE